MELKLYDTLTREKRTFVPLDWQGSSILPDRWRVRMYVCGPTVYDFAHIGNARPVIVFDVLFRLLRHIYGDQHVTYVRNITDVDDKINARAAERIAERAETSANLNAEIRELTEETYRNFSEDVAALGCLKPTFEPRATEYVSRADGKDMISLIETLIRSGNAYEAEGHVLFDVSSMPDYGQLSKRPLDEMIAGARVEVAPYKRSAMDFVLWKPSAPGEPGWESPWGRGRPGWHIECSAMSAALLGKEFDIHGGGIDLVFPHHENEIAQSRCAFHTPFLAKTWMHNGFLQVEGEKMSKSLGNFVTIRELLEDEKFGGRPWHGGVLRLAMLKTHYRQPIDFTVEQLRVARMEMDRYQSAVDKFGSIGLLGAREKLKYETLIDGGILSALSDDLNTPLAISRLHELCASVSDTDSGLRAAAALEFLGLMKSSDYLSYSDVGPIIDISLGARLSKRDLFGVIERLRVALANCDEINKDRLIREIRNWGADVEIGPGFSISLIDRESEETNVLKTKIAGLIAARTAARKAKNFTESDHIRDELAAMGVVLKDSKDGTTWEVAR